VRKDGLDESSPYKLHLTLTLPSPLKGEGKRKGLPRRFAPRNDKNGKLLAMTKGR